MKNRISLNGTQLKILAILCMTIDHAAMLFVSPDSIAYLLLRGIGRWTAPIMGFLLAQGFLHTRNFQKYFCRMLLFAVISQPFYAVMLNRRVPETLPELCSSLNVLFSMVIGLLLMKIMNKLQEDHGRIGWYPALLFCMIVTEICDWKSLIPVWAVLFCFYRKPDRRRAFLYLSITALLMIAEFAAWYDSFKDFSFQFGTLTALLPIRCYNGERGGGNGKAARAFSRWAFYVYYPLHMSILMIVWMMCR